MSSILLALIYLSFISLGLPDSVLGSAWPVINSEIGAPIGNMGIITMIISAGTILSSCNSNRLINTLGIHKITFFSIFITAISLMGFSTSSNFTVLCLWAIPYGLGAGSVDAALNNYAALNLESKHMNWLHCMWGIGATLGPYTMGLVLTSGHSFRDGYILLFIIQIILGVIIFISKPLWQLNINPNYNSDTQIKQKNLSIKEIFAISGVKEIATAFFCFSAVETTAGMWASSYLVYSRGISPEKATGFAALFYLGITIGRGICGFIAIKYNDTQMIRSGSLVMTVGVIILLIPYNQFLAFVGIALIGFGSSPIFPCIIHSAPYNFGADKSQSITGIQMAAAYTGSLTVPPLFGLIGRSIGFNLYPIFIGVFLVFMVIMYELMLKKIDLNN